MSKQGGVTGRCNCGAVSYKATKASDVLACYCKQCQRNTGFAAAASHVPLKGFCVQDPQGFLRWYESSRSAKRGFCKNCGSFLFWQMFSESGEPSRDYISVMVGSLDDTSTLILGRQIFTDQAQDYHKQAEAMLENGGSDVRSDIVSK